MRALVRGLPVEPAASGRGDQEKDPADAGFQVVLVGTPIVGWHRDHAHDSQGADGLPRRPSLVRRRAVLLSGLLIGHAGDAFAPPFALFATAPQRAQRAHAGKGFLHLVVNNARFLNNRCADQNDLKPSIGRVFLLIARWSCSTRLFRYFD